MSVIVIETIHHNKEWEKFLGGLPSQYEKDIAGLTMDWVKETYPEFKDKLNGELIAEVTREAKLGE